MTDYSTYDDDEIVSELEFAIYGCERALQQKGASDQIAMYNSRRKELQDVASDRGITERVDVQGQLEEARRHAEAQN